MKGRKEKIAGKYEEEVQPKYIKSKRGIKGEREGKAHDGDVKGNKKIMKKKGKRKEGKRREVVGKQGKGRSEAEIN